MWLFAKQGFVSIVQHRDDPKMLLVRSRFRGDLEALFPGAKVEETPAADYRFRARIHRVDAAERVRELAESIAYPNFKASLPLEDLDRRATYHAVWDVMAVAQERAIARRQLDLIGSPGRRPRAERKAKKRRRRRALRLRGGLR